MNTKLRTVTIAAGWFLCAAPFAGFAQGTAFTYQGHLNESGSPANGYFDLRTSLYSASTGGTSVAGPLTNSAVVISNGQFSILLDFGNVYDGTTYWLEVGARSNGIGGFTALSPRQELTPTPYAIAAENLLGPLGASGLSGTYGGALTFNNSANQFTGAFAGNGNALSNVNAATLSGLAASSFWQIGGNAGTTRGVNFLGTSDNVPLDLRVNNQNGLQLQYWQSGLISVDTSYGINTIGGYWGNSTSNNAIGATIAGGGYENRAATFPPSVAYYPNAITGDYGTIGGGYANMAGASATISGGYQNSASGTSSIVGGGDNNVASATESVVGGGINNVAGATHATVPGGVDNQALGLGSFAAGRHAQTSQDGSFIWGDGSEIPFTGPGTNNSFSVLASGGVFLYDGINGVHVDCLDNNNGGLGYGIKFGGEFSSGEGIASKRTAGGNQYGLDFFTSSANRMSIDVNGFVGINTTTPSERLEVNGQYVLIDGANANNGSGRIDAYIGGDGSGSDVQIGSMNTNITAIGFWNYSAGSWMHIACSSITIHGGADLAEPFPVASEAKEISQGGVVVIDDQHPGQVKLSEQPYDSRVAGVISGANGINPGIQMQQQGLLEGGRNVALTGRVYVQADTSNGAIRPGDMLTTSSLPGHAMRVTDHARAQGAILGKAMTGLSEHEGLVLVLVTLQ